MDIDAREYGQHLAMMLAASHFSAAEKQAWGVLVPDMTVAQLIKFDELLKADMLAQSGHELEHTAINLRTAQHKRDLALSALNLDAHERLDALEEQVKTVAS